MYAGRSIGVIIVGETNGSSIPPTLSSLPGFVDRIYFLGANQQSTIASAREAIPDTSRLHLFSERNGDSPEELVKKAYAMAIDEEMDVIAIIDPDRDVDPSFLPYLLDPIALGAADYAYVEDSKESRPPPGSFAEGDPASPYVQYIQHCKLVGLDIQRLDPFRGHAVFSRSALRQLHEYLSLTQGKRILATIPCLNEEISIGTVVLQTKCYANDVLVVDDGSHDNTAKVAADAGATVISHPRNLGKAAGVMTAVRYAKEHDYDIIILLDGDGQHRPEEIPAIVEPVLKDEADMVIGSRFLGGNGSIPLYRRLGQTFLTLLTNATSAHSTTDSQSGFRALSRRAMEGLTSDSEGYSIESDMISQLSKQGLKIQEAPITAVYDVPHKHKKNPFYHGYDLVARIVGEVGYKRPMLLFGLTGSALLLASIVFGFYTFTYYSATHILPFGSTIAFAIGLILGLLLIVTGLILNSLVILMNKK